MVPVHISPEKAKYWYIRYICGICGSHYITIHELPVGDLVFGGVGDGDYVALLHIELHARGLAPLH